MLLKITEKVLLDRNTMYSPIVHRIHIYWYCLLFLLLFLCIRLLFTITVLLLSPYRPSILGNMILVVLTELNDNVNGQLTLGLGKSMEETTSVFWVDLGYKLRGRLKVPLQGPKGWLASHLYCLLFHYFHNEIIVTVTEYLTVWPGSAPENWGCGPGYVRDPPKAWTMSPTDQFQ